ncbi:MAG: hypothetical protein IJU71_05190 [Selenomonadaceae bacterium]|nr:hypothetical protein [Selenomonadaceae bacterium]
MKSVEPIDTADMIYPELGEDEIVVPKIRKNILLHATETHYFPLDFRMRNVVIDSIARKYDQTIDQYPDPDDNDERLLIGPSACRQRHRLDCPYMRKVDERLSESDVAEENIAAIHLLGADDSEYNRQKFLIVAKDGIYFRDQTNRIDHYDYADIRFTFDGIELLPETNFERAGDFVLRYPLDEKFMTFAQEFLLLRLTTISIAGERHPFADAALKFRKEYLSSIVDTAAAEGKLDVETLIRIEYLARELRISAIELETYLHAAGERGFDNQSFRKNFNRLIADMPREHEKFVLFQDLLEAAIGIDDSVRRKPAVDAIKRAAGEKFVANYIDHIKQRRQAETSLYRSIQALDYKTLSPAFSNAWRMLRLAQLYNNDINLKLMDVGVLANEK